MLHRVGQRLDSLIDHYAAACAALSLLILALSGVGDPVTVNLLGLLLCMAGLTQRSAQVDLWTLVPLMVYVLACLASSLAAYGDITSGYGAFHGVFPVLYLLVACLGADEQRALKRSCALWTGLAAVAGLGQMAFVAVTEARASRLDGILGNPNAMGIFLVMGWFAVLGWRSEEQRNGRSLPDFLEPLVLMALAATLSMGSFAAMAVGVLVLLAEKRREASWEAAFRYACRVLARAALGMGTGLLIYLAAARTGVPWSCLFLLAYGGALMFGWRDLCRFLEAKPRMAALIAALGTLVALGAVLARPSAAATFAERLEMMGSGMRYLTADPLFGVGPFQWRMLDLHDGGKYFNTWHIHNVPLHVGVEMGWIAMAMLILAALRALGKKKTPPERALTAAFLFHNLMDTSFFYLGITALALMAAGEPRQGGRKLGGGAVKLLFALFAALFAWNLWGTLMTVWRGAG